MYRWNFAIMSRSSSRINHLARTLREAFLAEGQTKRIQLKVDLDPYGMF